MVVTLQLPGTSGHKRDWSLEDFMTPILVSFVHVILDLTSFWNYIRMTVQSDLSWIEIYAPEVLKLQIRFLKH